MECTPVRSVGIEPWSKEHPLLTTLSIASPATYLITVLSTKDDIVASAIFFERVFVSIIPAGSSRVNVRIASAENVVINPDDRDETLSCRGVLFELWGKHSN